MNGRNTSRSRGRPLFRTAFLTLAGLAALALIMTACGGSPTPTDECVSTTECSTNDDCPQTQHCNLNLVPPVCQTLFCGELGSACSEPALCQYQYCPVGYCGCERKCDDIECGPDPVCGLSCGICDDGFRCDDGTCVVEICEPDCTGLACGLDPVCATSCGQCDEGWECDTGTCVEIPVEQEMVTIPAGSYWMGCNESLDDDCNADALPYHLVNIDAFQIDRTEVTLAQYADCFNAGVCTVPNYEWKYDCNWGELAKFNHPVNCVDWDQATVYCNWLGKRLPTEAEWEKAARGTDGRIHPWGNEDATCELAVMEEGGDGCGTGTTWPVCSKSPAGDSPYGLCDMVGNVWEWVYDRYQSDWYDVSPADNPTGPGDDTNNYNRVVRGGGYPDYDFFMRVSHRNCYFPGYIGSQKDLGFRCAADVTE